MGDVCRVQIEDRNIWLLKPATFMNRSGQSMSLLVRFFRIPLVQVLVVHDEIDLLPGRSKLKRAGGHGGHNGLRDIISHSGNDFWRLRLGVGHPGHRDQVIDYVLSRPDRADDELIRSSIDEAIKLMPLIAVGELEKAMHRLHSKLENTS
jgi:PTH1 family peptidyl-tRNA hydrolase